MKIRNIWSNAADTTKKDINVFFKERKKLTSTFNMLNKVINKPKRPRYEMAPTYSLPPKKRFMTKAGNIK